MGVENDSCWFVIDRKGILTCTAHSTFATPTSYVMEVDVMLEALKRRRRAGSWNMCKTKANL
jgi:hypothetical protein